MGLKQEGDNDKKEEIDFVEAAKQGGPKPGQVVVIRIPQEAWDKANQRYVNGCVYSPPEED